MTSSSDDTTGLDDSVLEHVGNLLETKLGDEDLEGGRRQFLEGLQALEAGELKQAARRFRRAARNCDPPFDALARVARGECERARGNLGMALREWRSLATDDDAPVATRYMAWLSVAAVAEDRGDDKLLEKARDAIGELETSEET